MADLVTELKNSKKNFIYNIVQKGEDYQETITNTLKILIGEKGMKSIYVSINKDYQSLKTDFTDKGIDVKKIFFVDAVTKTTGPKALEVEDCIFIENVLNLTEMDIVFSKAVHLLTKKIPAIDVFLLLDNVASLVSIGIDRQMVTRFVRSLASQLKKWGMSGIIMSLDVDDAKELNKSLMLFCDKCITV